MTTVEEVTVRLGVPVTQTLVEDIEKAFSTAQCKKGAVRIFVDTETGCDLLVQIWNKKARKSRAGLEIASHLKTLGIVNHVVWKSEEGFTK